MDFSRRDFLSTVAWLGALGVSNGLVSSSARAQGTKIRLGEAKGAGQSAQFAVAIKDGLFEKYGVNVALSPFGSGAAMGPALIAGDLDIIATGDIPAIPIMAAGAPVKVLCPLSDFSADQAIVTSKKITKPEQLKGAKIALYKGSVASLFIQNFAEQNHLDINGISLIHMDPAQQPPALAAGQIDGYISWEPHIWSGTSHFPDSHVLARANAPVSYMKVFDLLVVREEFLDKHRPEVEAFTKSLVDALDMLKNDPDAPKRVGGYVRELLAVDIPVDTLAEMIKRREYTMTIDQEFLDIEKQNTEFLSGLGRIKTKPEVTSWLDTSVLKKVRPELVKI